MFPLRREKGKLKSKFNNGNKANLLELRVEVSIILISKSL